MEASGGGGSLRRQRKLVEGSMWSNGCASLFGSRLIFIMNDALFESFIEGIKDGLKASGDVNFSKNII